MDINQVVEAINTLDEVEIKVVGQDIVIFTYGGVAIATTLTDETIPRLRFSVDIKKLDIEQDEVLGELMYKLLDINTEIDPVAAAIDSTDPENIMIQVRTTLRVVDLQASEIVAEVNGLINALGEVFEIVRDETEASCNGCEGCSGCTSPAA
jgi:hypothetical protein